MDCQAFKEERERLRKQRKLEEERRKKEVMAQQKLRQMGVCDAGFQWIKIPSGYRCEGGFHFVTNEELGL
jgi:hypothetical protein